MRIEIAAHHPPVTADDDSDRIHHAEGGKFHLADLAESAALSGALHERRAKKLADINQASSTARAEREAALAGSSQRGAAEFFIGMYGVIASAEVEDHGSGHGGNHLPCGGVSSQSEQLSHDSGGGFETVAGAAGEKNSSHRRLVIAKPQTIGVDGGCRSAAHVHRGHHPFGKVKNGEPGRSFFIFGDANQQSGKSNSIAGPSKRICGVGVVIGAISISSNRIT